MATYEATIRSERELLLQHSSGQRRSPTRHANMAFSCSTSLIAPPISTKFAPYVPRGSKPKPKTTTKAKSMATTKTAEHSRTGVDSEHSGEWFYIDDNITMSDSDVWLPTLYEAIDASRSVGYSNTCLLLVTSE